MVPMCTNQRTRNRLPFIKKVWYNTEVETPVVKVGEYRGVKIYIRKLFRETFEYLIWLDNQLWCNQVEIQRESGHRFEQYSDEDTESAVAFMLHVAQEFVDDKLFEIQEYNRWENRVDRFKKKVGQVLFNIKYKLSEISWQKKKAHTILSDGQK